MKRLNFRIIVIVMILLVNFLLPEGFAAKPLGEEASFVKLHRGKKADRKQETGDRGCP